MRWIAATILGLFLVFMLYATSSLPLRGDPDAPASTHVAAYYIEESMTDTETPNVVTSVLVDYRGYDTFGETIVIFTAGLACVLLLRRKP